jgi:hypothetical protein
MPSMEPSILKKYLIYLHNHSISPILQVKKLRHELLSNLFRLISGSANHSSGLIPELKSAPLSKEYVLCCERCRRKEDETFTLTPLSLSLSLLSLYPHSRVNSPSCSGSSAFNIVCFSLVSSHSDCIHFPCSKISISLRAEILCLIILYFPIFNMYCLF